MTELLILRTNRDVARRRHLDECGLQNRKELIEEIRGIFRTGSCFRMKLHGEEFPALMPDSFHRSIIRIAEPYAPPWRKTLFLNGKTMILARNDAC